MQLGYLIEQRFLFLRKQSFPFFGFLLDLLHQAHIAFKLRLNCINTLAHTVLAYTDIAKLIAENQYAASQFLHCLRYGGNRILYRLHQLFDRCFQLTEQCIVCLDLSVDFTAVRYDAFLFQRMGNHTLVNGGLFAQTSVCMTAVVDAFVMPVSLQIAVGHVCPRLAPFHKLFLAVPTLGNGILPPIPGAFGMLVSPDIALRFCCGGSHIELSFAHLVGVLLLPALCLGLLKLGSGKAPFLAIPNAEIFLFGLVLPVTLFIKRAHRQQSVGMRIVTVGVMNGGISAHPV